MLDYPSMARITVPVTLKDILGAFEFVCGGSGIAGVMSLGAPKFLFRGSGLAKSVDSGNLTLNRAAIWGMSDERLSAPGGNVQIAT
jgi:hypothetical protein